MVESRDEKQEGANRATPPDDLKRTAPKVPAQQGVARPAERMERVVQWGRCGFVPADSTRQTPKP